jgi:hypothetical protein
MPPFTGAGGASVGRENGDRAGLGTTKKYKRVANKSEAIPFAIEDVYGKSKRCGNFG